MASTLVMRVSLIPLVIKQLKKQAEISKLLPKLPPPFLPPLSGRSFGEQYMLFQKKRRELGCPSYLWNFASIAAQVPCFLLFMISIRRMSLDHHPGFDCGGMLWFQNLTETPHGFLGSCFPILIAGLYFANIQISFQTNKVANYPGMLGLLAKMYKMYLNILTIPILYIGFHIPQGSLVYWMTNNALNLVQLLSVRHPSIREKLGLPKTVDPAEARITMGNLSKMQKKQDTQRVLLEHNRQTDDPSLDEHLGLAFQHMATGNNDEALPLLRKVIEKDSAVVGALVAMGQILYSKKLVNEAAEYFESAISKAEKDDSLLVVACYGAGISRIAEGKKWEGIENLKRIAEMEVPVSPMDQHCYYKALVLLGCTLSEEGHNSEAVKHLRRAATYDPGVDRFVKECEALIEMDECKAEDKTTGCN
ncbi:hypothetical protein QJS10_CPA16g00776 [Acorus calamus]|uniref:ALBINO3-like protein 2, chloroplastic n=1 Tax=Acorus calamus TaxID=4465 RepID=A0AAV9CZ37_ACOCL|nr:hypothetical protein QJS10_CPA16g00776 [Acorus calamus]